MAEAIITSMRDVSMDYTQPSRATHKEVQYTIDGKGPFSVYIPLDEYTDKKAEEMVLNRVQEWAKIVGKSIKPR